jgi:hypothetical protein
MEEAMIFPRIDINQEDHEWTCTKGHLVKEYKGEAWRLLCHHCMLESVIGAPVAGDDGKIPDRPAKDKPE